MSINRKTVVNSITYLLEQFPCVAIIGARQVGKTTLLHQLKPDGAFFDLEKQSDFELIQREFFRGKSRGTFCHGNNSSHTWFAAALLIGYFK